jgi:hypothetical protein
MKKVFIFFAVFFLGIVGIIVYGYWSYDASLTRVTINFTQLPNAQVVLYRGEKKDLVAPKTQGEGTVIQPGQTVKLEDWPYVIKVYGSDVAPSSQVVYPHGQPQTIQIPIRRTDDFLSKQGTAEKDAIASTIRTTYPKTIDLYTIQQPRLHSDGTWATVELVYNDKDSLQRDSLVAILHKESGVWKLQGSPSITPMKRTGVPLDVLQAAYPPSSP